MLIGLLLALIFGGGAESEFASSIPNIQKEIRRHVEDESRKDSLLFLVKEYEGAIKAYEKEKKNRFKQLNTVSTDRDNDTSEFLAAYDEYYQSRTDLISSLIDYRLLFQEKITEEELLQITEKALNSPERRVKKEQKQEARSQDRIIRLFVDLNEIVVHHIQDSLKAELVLQSLHSFESSLYATLDESYDLEVERKQRLNDRSTTREEILEMYSLSNQLRYATARNFAELRQSVIENTSQEEWKAINKELKAFLKN
jgi:hypothetical protein